MIVPSRRRFLFGAAVLLAAPAIAKASSLMPISTAPWRAPKLWGDGIHDDTAAIQWMLDNPDISGVVNLPKGKYLTTATISVPDFVQLQGPKAWLHAKVPGGDGLFVHSQAAICGLNIRTLTENMTGIRVCLPGDQDITARLDDICLTGRAVEPPNARVVLKAGELRWHD